MKKLMMMSIWAALIALTMTACSKSDDEETTDLTVVNQGCYYQAVGKEIVTLLYLGQGHAILCIDNRSMSGNATMTETTLDVTDCQPFAIVGMNDLNNLNGMWITGPSRDYHFTYTRTSDGLKLKYTDTTVSPAEERTVELKFYSKEFKYGII